MKQDQTLMTTKVKDLLSIFDNVGIASSDQFKDIALENHPQKYMKDFKSIIVYAEGKEDSDASSMGGFSDYL